MSKAGHRPTFRPLSRIPALVDEVFVALIVGAR
jgi:hypothetical protein